MIFGALFQKKQNGTTEAYYCTINTFRHCELYSFDAATLWSYFNVEIHLRQQEEAVCMILLRKQSYWRRKCKKLRQRYLNAQS